MSKSLLILLACFLLPAAGCSPKAGGGTGSGSPSLVKVFLRSDGSTMYFAGPLNYRQKDGDGQLEVDFTLNKFPDSLAQVVFNYTYFSKSNATFKPSSMKLEAAGQSLSTGEGFEKFFSEKTKKGYKYRYSTVFDETGWVKWVKTDKHQIRIDDLIFSGGKKHKKHIEEVRDKVIFPLQ